MNDRIVMVLVFVARWILRLRYRFEVNGLEKLNPETLHRPGGILFLPSHPTFFVEPVFLTLLLWPKYKARPLVMDIFYSSFHFFCKLVNALPIPDFGEASNSWMLSKIERIINTVSHDLKTNQSNYIIFPAGRAKSEAREIIGGASFVYRVLQETPETNVVLIRVKGLWGSSFSRALSPGRANIGKGLWNGFKHILKNCIFFTPKRTVTIDLEPLPADFPRSGSRADCNRYLEMWFNRPDNLTPQKEAFPGDSLILVPYSIWTKKLPSLPEAPKAKAAQLDLKKVPTVVQTKVYNKIAEIAKVDAKTIKPNMDLSTDLSMDSLNIAEIAAFLKDEFDVPSVPTDSLTNIEQVLAYASMQLAPEEKAAESPQRKKDLVLWKKNRSEERVFLPSGNTILEMFLRQCKRQAKMPACADTLTGVRKYSDLLLRTILLAKNLQKIPHERIGIFLPASIAAPIVVFACYLAGKVPVMMNWTLGPRNLQQIKELSHIKVIISSELFLTRLQHVNLAGMEELIITLEELRWQFTWKEKLDAFLLSMKSPTPIMKSFGVENISENSLAIILFTSGTESAPKGVPLTHSNIVNNLRSCFESIAIYQNDVMLSFLPPFHSFGFTIGAMAGMLGGFRTFFSPNPTNYKAIDSECERWGVTVLCTAPSFLKGMLKSSKPDQFHTLRLCITGAEKTPDEIFQLMEKIGKRETVHEGYGITECGPVLTFNRTGNPQKGVGQPIIGVDICIVDIETLKPIPIGQRGLILASGPSIFSDYLNPGLSSPFVTIGGKVWYITGDLGILDEHNNLILAGRLKRFIKIGGEMISLPSMEEALTLEFVGASTDGPVLAVCSQEEADGKPRIVLFSTLESSLESVNMALRKAGFSNIAKVSEVIHLPEIPLLGTGKIDYRSLEKQLSRQPIEAVLHK